MGSTQLEGMLEWGTEEQALGWHMEYNLYPSRVKFIEVARIALEHARMDEFDKILNIAEIMGNDRYNKAATVGEVIEGWHLEGFLQEDEYGE